MARSARSGAGGISICHRTPCVPPGLLRSNKVVKIRKGSSPVCTARRRNIAVPTPRAGYATRPYDPQSRCTLHPATVTCPRFITVSIFACNPAGRKSLQNHRMGRSSDSFPGFTPSQPRVTAVVSGRRCVVNRTDLPRREDGTHSNGYCSRFALLSLFSPSRGPHGLTEPDAGAVGTTDATQIYA